MHVLRSLVELATGRRCLDCAALGIAWCETCLNDVVDVRHRWTPNRVHVTSGARYEGSVRRAIVSHKEEGQLSLVTPLARLLGAALLALPNPERDVVLVGVPSTRASVRARGHDHSGRLAKASARLVHKQAASPLRWSRPVADQSGLSVGRRMVNVRGGMVARPNRGSMGVWLVDDIMTSGATIDEAVRALAAAGWEVAGVSVVASVDSRMALAATDRLR